MHAALDAVLDIRMKHMYIRLVFRIGGSRESKKLEEKNN